MKRVERLLGRPLGGCRLLGQRRGRTKRAEPPSSGGCLKRLSFWADGVRRGRWGRERPDGRVRVGGLGAGEGEVPTAGEVGFGGADAEPLFGDLPGVVGDPGGAAFAGGGFGVDGAGGEEIVEEGGGGGDGFEIVLGGLGGDEVIGGEGGGADVVEAECGLVGDEAEAQGGGLGGEVMCEEGEGADIGGGVGVWGWCGAEEQGGAGGGGEGDGAAAAVEGFGAGLFGQVADDEDGAVGGFSEGAEVQQDGTDGLVLVGVDGGGEDGHQGIDDDERGMVERDGAFEDGEVGWERGEVFEGEDMAAGDVGAGGIQAGADGIGSAILGVEGDRGGGAQGGLGVIGEGEAAGDAGSQVQG